MSRFKIALLQIAPEPTLKKNREKGLKYCRMAKEMDADIALFPEMFSNGYNIYDRPASEWQAEAIDCGSDFAESFRSLAKELDMAIGITLLEKYDPSPRNTLILFDRHGELVFKYSKVHTCDFGAEIGLTPGNEFFVADLDTAGGIVRVGAMICYDREFPESARLLMLKGAEVVIVPNACPMEINRLSQLRARAYENMMCIATCNYPSAVPDCNGHSSVFDGVAYLPGLPGSRDTCLVEADGSEGIFTADIGMDMLRSYRQNEVHGNAYRRPELYGSLLDTTVSEPFIRERRNSQDLLY